MNAPLPDFLLPLQAEQSPVESGTSGHVATAIVEFPRKLSEMSSEMLELERQTFVVAFESVLEHLANGATFESFCREYHVRLSVARFRRWIFRDTERKRAYDVAKAVGMEAMEDQLVRIADGLNEDGTSSPNEVARSSLMIETRKYVMRANNRKKYGDVKQIDQTTTTRFDPARLSNHDLTVQLLEALGVTVPNVIEGAIDGNGEDVGDVA